MSLLNPTRDWRTKVRDYCDSQYEVIDVKPGDINNYQRCHNVARHYAVTGKHNKLALVMYRYGDNLLPNVHFINYHNNKFIDNSVGIISEDYEYRFIRFVSKKEFKDVGTILTDTQNFFTSLATRTQKLFGDISL